MNEIEKKALALVNAVEREEGLSELTPRIMRGLTIDEALCRAIETHEAFRQEVSDAIEEMLNSPGCVIRNYIGRFIITKPDPLVEALSEIDHAAMAPTECADQLRAALAARGLEIREIEK